MPSVLRILMIEDLPTDTELIRREIRKSGIQFTDITVDTKQEFIDALASFNPDIILSDYSLPEFDGKLALEIQQKLAPNVPFVLVTGSVNEETAVECMKMGADDYIIKQNLTRLGEAIRAAIQKKKLIAEKIQVESTLRKSEARYRSLFENSAIPIFEEDLSDVKIFFNELNSRGITNFREYFESNPADVVYCASLIRITDINEESLRFFQARDKEEILNDMSTYFLDESWPIFKEELIALAEGQTYFECEFPVSTFKWEHRDLILKLSVRPDSIDTLQHVFVSFVDITDRKKAEAALTESEELFRTAFENATVGVCMVNMEGHFLNVNSALCNLWGYSKEELLQMSFNDIALEEDKPIGFNSLRQLISGEINQANFEKRYLHKDGSVIWASVSTGLVHSTVRRDDYFVSYLEDITERKESEITIRKNAELYMTLTENMRDVVWIIEPESMRFRYLSPSAKKMVGFSAEEIMSLPINAMFPSQYGEKLVNDLMKIVNDCDEGLESPGTFHTQIIKQPCKGGKFIWAEVTAYGYRNEETGKLELHGAHRDITERKNAEAQLMKSEEKFRQLYENAADPIQLLDEKLNFLDCNEATVKYLGAQTKQQILNCLPDEISPEFQPDGMSSKEKSIIVVRKAYENGSYQFEWVHRKFSGEPVTVDINLTRITMDGMNLLLVHWRDITERKQIENALLKSEEKFRLLAENASDVIWTMDINGKNTYISPSVTRLRGYTPEEAMLQTPEESLSPASAELANSYQKKVFEKLGKGEKFESYNLIVEQPCKDGTSVFVDITVSGIFDDNGNFVSFLGVSRDITDRRKAEIALMESQQQYKMLLENQGEGAGIVDLNEVFTFANPAAEQIFEVPEGTLVGRNLTDFVPHFELMKVETETDLRSKGNKSTYELQIHTFKGGLKNLLVTATPQYNMNGILLGTFGVFRDITEWKKAEELLKERQFWLTESQRVGRIGSFSLDLVKNEWSSSEVLNDILGLQANAVKNIQTWLDTIHPDQRREMELYFVEEIFENLNPFNKEYKIIRADNQKESWVWGKGELSLDDTGRPVKMIGTILDISERKNVEEALIAAKDRAEENDRLKTAFLNNISHEIRTPMNAIIGFSGFLNEPNLAAEKRKYFTDIICNASNQLLSIISDIINIATIEAGQETLKKSKFNINHLLRNLFNQFELKANSQNIRLKCLTPLPDEETNIETDETKLMQVISNLVGNSLKFTRQGHVTFGYKVIDQHLEFFIDDSGIGIPESMHREIFERFRQADSTIARQFGGTGLGLSISKAYVELMGGTIWLKSVQGQGSTFYFTIPFQTYRNGHSKENSKHMGDFLTFNGGKTILIAEDEDFNYLLLEQLLADMNLTLIRVTNGAEAVVNCKSNPEIDLVLMDVKMPVMDGYEATRIIKQERPDLPVIMQTAYSRESDRLKALEAGCDEYVSKPIAIDRFMELLKKHFDPATSQH
ncbi:MAG: PAS domain S-box protein [Bacteroidales bacterium]|nr:PAS domain S-box protein [Bacteroidales bacterium]